MRISPPARVPSSHHFQAKNAVIFLRGGILALLLALFLAYSPRASAQITNVTNDQATPIPGAGHDYIHMLSETVNPGNGSVSLRIKTPTPSGRLFTIPFGFDFDTSGIHRLSVDGNGGPHWAYDQTPLSRGGWSYLMPLVTYIYGTNTVIGGQDQGESSSCEYYSGFVFQDPSGTRHALGISAAEPYSPGACLYPVTAVPNAGDDYYRASTSPIFSDPNAVVVSADGTVYSFGCSLCNPSNYGDGLTVVHIEDRNGNIV